MRRHSGLGRRGALADGAGDPLDGLVNLFDLGIVLAIAFLVAGVGIALDRDTGVSHTRSTRQRLSSSASAPAGAQSLPSPNGAAKAAGRGRPVGTVYRLSDGQLVYVRGR